VGAGKVANWMFCRDDVPGDREPRRKRPDKDIAASPVSRRIERRSMADHPREILRITPLRGK
jgi:hypothetical protein